jgi:hypothetical protein
VYVFGGAPSTKENHKDVEQYNRRTNKWTLLDQHMSVAREYLAAATVGNAVYLLGGRLSDESQRFDVVECFDFTTKKFTTRQPLPSVRSGIAAVGVRVSSATLSRLTKQN